MTTDMCHIQFLSEKAEKEGNDILFERRSIIHYEGERQFIVSEADCDILKENGIEFKHVDEE